MNLLLTRTFFSLQRPWLPTTIALGSLVINLIVSLALYKPYGIAGLVIGTAISSAVMMLVQAYYLREPLGGSVEGRATAIHLGAITVAAVLLGIVAWIAWSALDDVFGRSIIGQLISVGGAGVCGATAYWVGVLWIGLPEARQIRDLIRSRLPLR
jgi:putative peptidoglycan lipid II flippase